MTVDNASSSLANLGRFGVNQAYRDQVIDNVSHFATALVHHPLDTVHRVEQAIDNLSIEEQGQLAISILSTGGEGLVTKVGSAARLGGRLGAKGLEGAVNVARAAASAEGDALLFANSADRIGARSLALQTGGIRLTEVYKAEQATAKAADIAGEFTPIRFADDGRVFALVPTEEGATSLSWTPTEKLLAEASEVSAGTTAMRNVGRESMTTGATGVADDTIVLDDASVLAARRAYLNEKFGRTGDLDLDINIRGRQQTATDFYLSQGYASADIPSHMRGIDFTQPVDVIAVNGSKRLYQFKTPGAPQGSYYSFDPTVRPTELGISPYGIERSIGKVVPKVQDAYLTAGPVQMLRSTAATIMDTWSVPGSSYYTLGGARQLFSGNKAAFMLVAP